MRVVQRLSDAPLKKRLAFIAGGLLANIFPSRAAEVEAGKRVNSKTLLDRFIRNGIRAKALRAGDHRKLRDMLRQYWSVDGTAFADCYGHRFEKEFLAHDAGLFDEVENIASSLPLHRVYEIGCGNGRVLEFIAQRLPQVERLVGIDIDASQIERNATQFEGTNLSFVAGGALEWLRENAEPQSLVVSNGGVLEYFLEEEVATLFEAARKPGNTAIALIETLATNHDLDQNPATCPYGPELSFSHNYPRLLREAGFEIEHHSERISNSGMRWIRLLGVARP